MSRALSKTVAVLGRSVRPSRSNCILPDPQRMIVALRQVGYSFEQAISDLVDNSINGRASHVLIRFICDENSIRSCVIADDGVGMSESRMNEAMRFGSLPSSDPKSLGKYGMGLKLASLSHASRVTVLSRQRGTAHGRRWTVQGIGNGWRCEVLNQSEVLSIIDSAWGPVDLRKSGTLIVWDEIDRLPVGTRGLRNLLRTLQSRLELHLGLCFHRFIDNRSLTISIDQQSEGRQEHSIRTTIDGLDPFAYPASGKEGYPKIFRAVLPGIGTLDAEAHIWPPHSESAAYKLGNKAAARQGFYFYRNNRLIQAGGWNGVVQHETEPHSSLARVRINLPIGLDSAFGLNVQKSAIVVPVGFQEAIMRAQADDGQTFEEYRRAAQLIYREHDPVGRRMKSLVPGDGLPKKLRLTAIELLAAGETDIYPVNFEWADLPELEVFRIQNEIVLLNSIHRKKILGGLTASGADVPLFKLMLFLLLRDHLGKDSVSSSRRRRLDQLNRLLSHALEF